MAGMFLAAMTVGIAIGVCSGMLGIGGGMVMVPVFRLLFGMSPTTSTATSLFTIIPTSVSGAVAHIRGKTCVPKLGIVLGLGGACTSWIGVELAQLSPGWAVMLAAALVIGYSATTMLRKALKAPKAPKTARIAGASGADGASGASGASRPSKAAASAAEGFRIPAFEPSDYAKAVGIGALAGIASGYVGLGGGFIMVPLMLSLLRMPMKLASGTSLIAVMILAAPATVVQCMLGNVDYLVGIAMACGSIPGAVVGARLAARIPERTLRFVFAAFLGLAAILLVAKELGLLG